MNYREKRGGWAGRYVVINKTWVFMGILWIRRSRGQEGVRNNVSSCDEDDEVRAEALHIAYSVRVGVRRKG